MFSKIAQKFDKYNCIEWMICFVGLMTYGAYAVYTYYECPFETFIDKFYLIESMYGPGVTLNDLLIPSGEHGQLAANILFLINVKVFDLTTFFDMVVNILLCVIPMALIAIFYPIKYLGVEKSIVYYLALIVLGISNFTSMQTGAGGMSLQVRLGLSSFCLLCCFVDNYVVKKQKNILLYVLIIINVFLTMNFWGTAYNFAGVPTTCLLFFVLSVVEYIKNKEIRWDYLGIIVAHVASFILYFFQYGLVGMGVPASSESVGFIEMILQIDWLEVFRSILCWCGSILLGRHALEDGHISPEMYLLIGGLVLLLIVICIVIYLKNKMYEKTILPILFLGYFFVLFVVLFFTRSQVAGWVWFCSSWYTVHTKVASMAMIWILLMYYSSNDILSFKGKCKGLALIGVLLACISTLMFATSAYEKRLPHERIWLLDKKQYFYVESIEEFPVSEEGITPLFQTPERSMWAIDILKKYKLSLFRE